MKKTIKRGIVITIALMCGTLTGCSSCNRMKKSFSSDMGGGLKRKVTVYDYEGKEIKSWSGKFDVSSSETEVYFDDSDNKRIIIHGGIVINEEK
jgi:hypothetical protein